MGFYIKELPTEFNGITMQEADYLADEFLKDTPCNRMWDAMRALRDFYGTVMNEAVEITEQTEPQKKMCANCKHIKKHNGKLADYVCDRKGSIVTNPYDKECDEMWERKDEPQTDCTTCDQIGRCERGRAVDCPLTERSE